MKYTVVEVSGSQYLVKPGEQIEVDRLSQKEGTRFEAEKVLMVGELGEKAKFGTPYLEDEKVVFKVIEHFKGKKVRVATYKAKSRSRRVVGFRAALTRLEVVSVGSKEAKKVVSSKSTKKK